MRDISDAPIVAVSWNPIGRRIQMRKISMFAAALVLIGIAAWNIATAPRVVASNPVGIDPFQMMISATDLPTAHWDDDSLVYN